MFSRMVPWNSQVSWRTIPNLPPELVAGEVAGVDAVDQDPPGVDVVEAHQQVHERGLAGARGADDGDLLPASTWRSRSSISGWSGS